MKPKYEIVAELVNNESFVRWIRGKASVTEQQKWDEWIRKDPQRQEIVDDAKRLYTLPFARPEHDDTEEQLHRLQKELDKRELQQTSLKSMPSHSTGKPGRYKWAAFAAAAAAVVVMAIGLVWLQFGFQMTPEKEWVSLETDYGQTETLELQDGSQIIVNANSTLRYQPELLGSDEVTFKVKGEAFFTIEHNPERTFKVRTRDGVIKDIGTKFNVHSRESGTQVALVEGKVEVTKETEGNESGPRYIAGAGEFIEFSVHAKNIQTDSSRNLEVYTSWTQDKLVLDDTPFGDIVSDLEQKYGVDIQVEDKQLLKRKVSGSIRNPSLEIVLKGLAQTMRLDIKQSDGRIIIASKDK